MSDNDENPRATLQLAAIPERTAELDQYAILEKVEQDSEPERTSRNTVPLPAYEPADESAITTVESGMTSLKARWEKKKRQAQQNHFPEERDGETIPIPKKDRAQAQSVEEVPPTMKSRPFDGDATMDFQVPVDVLARLSKVTKTEDSQIRKFDTLEIDLEELKEHEGQDEPVVVGATGGHEAVSRQENRIEFDAYIEADGRIRFPGSALREGRVRTGMKFRIIAVEK